MALLYYLYDTDYGNTIVNKSNVSFAPVSPYEEIHIDFSIPEIQPLYLYANAGGTGGTIIANTQQWIDAYLTSNPPVPTPDNNITYGEYSATTAQLNQEINNLALFISGFTGSTNLQTVTSVGSTTNIESTFSGGLKTNHIKPTGDTTTAIQIQNTTGGTIINIDTVSGFTGHGTIDPKGLVHAYGTDNQGSLIGTQSNAFIIDGNVDVDKDIQWAEQGVPKWAAETYRNENADFWYLYNVEADNSPLTVMETGRIGISKQTNILNYHAALLTVGLNDLNLSGIYTQNYNTVYELEIIASGSPDTYHWKKSLDDGITFGSWSPTSGCTLTPVELEYGVFINFENTTGHTVGQLFNFGAFSQIPQATLTLAPMGIHEVFTTDDYTAPIIIYNDITATANGGLSTQTFPIFNVGTGGTKQALYLGFTVEIHSVYFLLKQVGESLILVPEYWNGTSWIALNFANNNLIDGTNNFTQNGKIIWSPNTMSGWDKYLIPDNPNDVLYWIRFRTASNPTISPIASSLSIGNDKRFSIYSAFNDYRPAMYVNANGAQNIGGGTISRENKLQINSGSFLDVAVGSGSLVEMDSTDPQAADLRIKLVSEDTCGTGIVFVKTRGDLNTTTTVLNGDELGHLWFRAKVGTTGATLNSIVSQYTGDGTTSSLKGDLIFNTANGSFPVERVRINASGNTGFGITPSAIVTINSGTTTTAALKLTKGDLLTTPQMGAVEFDGYFTHIGTTGNTGITRNTFAYLNDPVFTGDVYLPAGTVYADGIRTNTIRPLNDGLDTLKIVSATGDTTLVTFNNLSGFTGFGTIIPTNQVHIYGTDTYNYYGINPQTNGLNIDGVVGADKVVTFSQLGVPKWGAGLYRGEEGKYWDLINIEGHTKNLTVSDTGRVGVNNPPTIMDYHAILETGGPNDINISGNYTQNYTSVYQVEIDTISGATDTFRWRTSVDEGQTFGVWSSSVELNYSPYELEYGVYVYWDNLTGHTLSTTWIFTAFSQLPRGTFMITPNKFNEVQQTLNFGGNPIVYEDVTGAANSSSFGSTITMFNTGTTANALYFGTINKLNSIFFNADTFGVGVTLITEYWDGSTWTALNTINNLYNDNTFNLTKSGSITWESSTMTGWIPAYLQDLSGDTSYILYWIRLRTSTSPTTAPIANSFARGGNYRLAVMTSPHDFKPSMYVDSLGRTSIGGGNITGTNLLQINKSYNIPTSTAHPSLVEIDSENSCATDLKLRLSSNDACGTGIILGTSRGTLSAQLNAQNGDEIGHLIYRTFAGGAPFDANTIISKYLGDSTTKDTALILSSMNSTTMVENIRLRGDYVGFGGVESPTARIHITGGTTSIAPLRFTSGALLSSPQAGAVEFLGDKFYGTTTGSTRCTFAFLEAPQFTGNVNLPSTTCLNSVNLCNYILQSGGSNNTNLVNQTQFVTYTATTVPYLNTVITGITNGLTKYTCHDVKLGGSLSENTVITGDTYNFTLSSKALNLCAQNNIDINSKGGSVTIRGNNTGNTEMIGLMVNACQIIVTDNTPIPTGIEYFADYSLTYSNRSLVDKEYVDNKAAGLNPLSAVLAATDIDINIAVAPATIDGITPYYGARILVKAQTSGATNGIYDYNGNGNPMTRSTDFDTDAEVVKNSYVAVLSGVTNENTSWILNTPNPITVGVTSLEFVLFSSQAGVTAGNGICVTQSGGNNIISIKSPANCGLCIDVSGLYINPNIGSTGICYISGALSIDGAGLAGNSISWTGNTFNVNPATGTLSTALNSKLNTSTYATYTGATATDINNRLLTSTFGTYTGTTAPAQFASKSFLSTYTGTTAPNTYVSISNFNTYSGNTAIAIGLKAPITSPTFLVSAFAPTPALNNSTTAIATTAWYFGQCATANPSMNGSVSVGTSTCWSHSDHVHPSDTSRLAVSAFNIYSGNTATAIGLKANITSPTFLVSACAPTPAVNNNTTCIATTAFVIGQASATTPIMDGTAAIGTCLTYARANHVHPSDTTKASLAGATFTGAVAGLTCAVNTNTTAMATTAFVVGQASATNPLMNGTVAIGTSLRYSREDHVHASDTSRQATITGAATTITASNLTTDRVLVSDGSGKVAVSTVTAAQLITAANVYGSEFQLAESAGSSTTTSTTPQTKVTLTTTSLPAGTYKIMAKWRATHTSTSNSMAFDVTVNGTSVGTLTPITIEAKDTTNVNTVSVTEYVALSGVNTILLRYWNQSANSTTIADAAIELIRVS